jgi:hypothetical protein
MEGTCIRCSLPLGDEDTFCGSCGQPVAPAATVLTSPVPPMTGPPPPPPPRAPADSSGRAGGPAGHGWPNYPGPATAPDAALGQRTVNEHYLGQRLLYDKVPEDSFDPIGNPRLIRQFLLHGLLYFVVYAALGAVAGVGLLILAVIGIGFGVAVTLWWIGAIIVGLAFLCLYWLIPVPAQLSEWKMSVDDKAHVAPVTFDHIAWALQRHQTPLDMVQVRRLKLAGGESRDYLEVRRGLFSGLICAFAYGNDLYVGWTFWVRISPAGYLLMFIARLWQTLMRRGTDLYVSLRYDYARAMREAIHSVAREGIDVAVGEARPQGQNIGQSLQVTVTDVDV